MKRIILIASIIVGVFQLNFSQTGALKGKVTDKESGSAIQNAKIIVIKEKSRIAESFSTSDGTYIFSKLLADIYIVKVECTGYKSVLKQNISIQENKSVVLNFHLVKEPIKERQVDDKLEISIIDAEEESVNEIALYQPVVLSKLAGKKGGRRIQAMGFTTNYDGFYLQHNTESYDLINENIFRDVLNNPLSTFSVDVDRASYSNVRRFLKQNQMPYKDAVRIEEMINYFDYDYPQPEGENPFSINMELSKCPWNNSHDLLMIGLQGKEIKTDKIPAGNFVFLIDVSGSMNSPNKLPLLRQAFKILIENLRPEDKVAIVVYAGAAGVVLESTSGKDKSKILGALDQLQAGGSTAGGAGIKLAYKIAKQNFIENGNNRVILATDGDFNVGASSDAEMVRLIEEKRNNGVFLSITGFGMGNYKDSKMEQLSNAGNGNYAYIDNILEAKKVFGKEIWGTLYTIAKDVKFQLEFNPTQVKAYRLIGYENRMLNKEDFNDDKKDAGEIGSGHTVTALYEIIPAGSEEQVSNIDPLEYQKTKVFDSKNLLTVKLRYKEPDEDVSKLIVRKMTRNDIEKDSPSDNFRFSASVAEFGMILRDSQFKAESDYNHVLSTAKSVKGKDKDGYRSEFITLVETAQLLQK